MQFYYLLEWVNVGSYVVQVVLMGGSFVFLYQIHVQDEYFSTGSIIFITKFAEIFIVIM